MTSKKGLNSNNQLKNKPYVSKNDNFTDIPFKSPCPVIETKFETKPNTDYIVAKKGKKLKIIFAILVTFLIVTVVALTATVIGIYVSRDLKKSEVKSISTTLSTTSTTTTSSIISTTTTITETETTTKNITCDYGYTKTYCDECGVQYSIPNVKIEGGIAAHENTWPSMALIEFKYRMFYILGGVTYEATKKSICGGNLINRKTILTAAQCYQNTFTYLHIYGGWYTFIITPNVFYPTFESMYKVYLGLYDNSFVLSRQTDFEYEVESFIKHPFYDSVNQLNDIAIIKLKNEATLGLSIQPACLPNPAKTNFPTLTNINAWTVGWGLLDDSTNTATSILHNIKITLYPTTSCFYQYQSRIKDWSRQLCAGDYYNTNRDACTGDEGGPLFVKDMVNGKPKYVLAGVISYAQSCGLISRPRIFTKVSYYLDWISQNSY